MNLKELTELLSEGSVEARLEKAASLFPGKVIFTTSFGLEDQAISHIIFSNSIDIEVVTLDTGRLFPETYKVFNETRKKYNKPIKVFFPDREDVEKMVTEKGPYSFYYSKENRLECCHIRKVIPLNRALAGKSCWISGIRADQSDSRSKMHQVEHDVNRDLYKFYPLFNWTYNQVREYVKLNNVPYNSLHDKGFVSIGCEPCTRAVQENGDFRSGRWWWENGNEKECGLHLK
ncbi:MAG TPA: phosphoadenylyl-sulfate reductase [Bacteroidales bacterium]|nr:phosphoadenylyl-sulfate reductase [Bacteroidales bacterium]